jgi:hypothetical protein
VDGWDAAKWRFGPLAVTPKVELKNLGWDSNVFNESENPKSDFTATADVPIDWWLRFALSRLGINPWAATQRPLEAGWGGCDPLSQALRCNAGVGRGEG